VTIVTKSLLDPAEPRSMKGKYIQVQKYILVAIVTKSLLDQTISRNTKNRTQTKLQKIQLKKNWRRRNNNVD